VRDPELLADERVRTGEPGTILGIDESGVLIECSGPTLLRVQEMQLEGKRRMSARDVANGLRLAAGDVFGVR
jgi:methionyl-tRNA formyltransferase